MKMYVANCTIQAHDFLYRLPETNSHRMQRIGPGSQIRISGDLNQPEIDSIVKQHEKYGMLSVDEASRVKRRFVGLCYSVDAPVKIERMEIVLDMNNKVLVAEGERLRREAAVATATAIEKELEPVGGNLTALEMSVVEERRDGRDVTDPEIAEGVRVDRTHDGEPAKDNAASRRRRAARRGAE
jgi:hypothetical protein